MHGDTGVNEAAVRADTWLATGDPNDKELPHWPSYEAGIGQYMDMGDVFTVRADLCTDVLSVMEKVNLKFRS